MGRSSHGHGRRGACVDIYAKTPFIFFARAGRFGIVNRFAPLYVYMRSTNEPKLLYLSCIAVMVFHNELYIILYLKVQLYPQRY